METFSTLLALCAGNSPVIGEFPAQRPVTRSFDVFFYLICAGINGWVNSRDACDLRRHHCNVEHRRFDFVYRRNNRLKQWLRLNDTHTRFQFTRSSLLFPLLLSLHYYNNCNIVIIIVSLSLSLLLTWSCGFMPAYIFVLVNTIQGIA